MLSIENVVPWVLALIIASLADVITTRKALERPGTHESNKLVAWLMDKFGDGWIVFKFITVLASAYFAIENDVEVAIPIITVALLIASYSNHKKGR